MSKLKALVVLDNRTPTFTQKFAMVTAMITDLKLQYSVDIVLLDKINSVNGNKYKYAFLESCPEYTDIISSYDVEVINLSDLMNGNDNLDEFIKHLFGLKQKLYGKPISIVLIDSIEKLNIIVEKFRKVPFVFFDLETSDKVYYFGNTTQYIICMSFVDISRPEIVYVVYFKHPESPFKNNIQEAYEALRPMFEDSSKIVCAQKIVFDRVWVDQMFGYKILAKCWCTLLMHHLLDMTAPHDLESLGKGILGLLDYKSKFYAELDKIKAINGIKDTVTYDMAPLPMLTEYVAMDSYGGGVLAALFIDKLKEVGLYDLYINYSIPSSDLMYKTKVVGQTLNMKMNEFLDKTSAKYLRYLEDLVFALPEFDEYHRVMIYVTHMNKNSLKGILRLQNGTWSEDYRSYNYEELFIKVGNRYICFQDLTENNSVAGKLCVFFWRKKYSLSSPIQLAEILYGIYKLPVVMVTPTKKPSTSADAMDILFKKFDNNELKLSDSGWKFMILLKEHKVISILRNTFIVGYIHNIHPDGKLHGEINISGTGTGRNSSSAPNLQQIPAAEDEPLSFAAGIKSQFIPNKPGNVFIDFDQAGVELRFLAAFSGDKNMIAAFVEGKLDKKKADIHKHMAAVIFTVLTKTVIKFEDVTKTQRKQSKPINFGLAYGKTEKTLADESGLTVEEVRPIIDALFKGYPDVKKYIDKKHEEVNATGGVSNVFGIRYNLLTADQLNEFREYNSKRKYHVKGKGAERESVNYGIQGPAGMLMNMILTQLDDNLINLAYYAAMYLTVHDSGLVEGPPDKVIELVENYIEPIATQDRAWLNGVPLAIDIKVGPYGLGVDYADFVKDPTCINNKLKDYIRYHSDFNNYKQYIADKLTKK